MAYDASLVSTIDRKSSIEREPRTLTIDQLQYAREAALYVVRTRSMEDAMRTFTEGLKPVVNAARQSGEMMMDLSQDMSYYEVDLRPSGIRDTVSVPF